MEKKIELHESNTSEYLGYLMIDFKLVAVSEDELQNVSIRNRAIRGFAAVLLKSPSSSVCS